MLDSVLRPKIQKHIDNIVYRSFLSSTHPNTISVLGCILGITSAVLIYYQIKYLAALFLLASGVADILDGTVARVFQKKTLAGCSIDIVFDRLIECSVIFALFLISPEQRSLVSMLLLVGVVMCLTSFFVVSMLSNNTSEKSFHYSPGICERGEAFIFFISMIIFPKAFQLLGYIFSSLMLITAVVRIIEFIKQDKLNNLSSSHESDE